MTRCLVALGSNLGDRLAHLADAVVALDEAPGFEVRALSALYETAPVGGPDAQGRYLNAALLAETALAPAAVLALLQSVERAHDRQRAVHWGPRTLDLDLLVHGDARHDGAELELPHPRMHERRFVMVPVCDVAADLAHPRLGRAMADLLAALPVEPGDLRLFATDWARRRPTQAAAG